MRLLGGSPAPAGCLLRGTPQGPAAPPTPHPWAPEWPPPRGVSTGAHMSGCVQAQSLPSPKGGAPTHSPGTPTHL